MSDDSIVKPKKKRKYKLSKKKSRRKSVKKSKAPKKITFDSTIIQNKVKRLFDPNQPDLSYITKDKKLLKKHIKFINDSEYCSMRPTDSLATRRALTIKRPKSFISFAECYTSIYNRWTNLLSRCYLKLDPFHKYFGGRGVKLCDDFLDCKKFCIWCLANGLTTAPNSYEKYLVRKDKSKDYTPDNVRVISEKQLHSSPEIYDALGSIILAKSYENNHHESVSYVTAYTRYYLYDLTIEDSTLMPYDCGSSADNGTISRSNIGFLPKLFYKSIADETSCTFSEFWSRMHSMYLSKLPVRPYELLRKDFSTTEYAASIGKKTYKRLWEDEFAKKKANANYDDSAYSKLEKDLLSNPYLKDMKVDQPNSIIEDFIKTL